MKSLFYGGLCGVVILGVLSWGVPRRSAQAAILSTPPAGRFQLVQLHPNSETEWSGILDTETGCTWVYTSQTPPTDDEVSAAPAGEQRAYKVYQQALGGNFLSVVAYDDSGPSMNLPGMAQASTVNGARFSTLATEEYYCDEARQNSVRAAAAR